MSKYRVPQWKWKILSFEKLLHLSQFIKHNLIFLDLINKIGDIKMNLRSNIGHVGLGVKCVAVGVAVRVLVGVGRRWLTLRAFIGRVPHWIDYVQQTTSKFVLIFTPMFDCSISKFRLIFFSYRAPSVAHDGFKANETRDVIYYLNCKTITDYWHSNIHS